MIILTNLVPNYTGLINSVGSSVSSRLSGDLDYQRTLELQGMQQSFNASEAEKNRKWQEMMSNTAYQRQAADLKAAGYNPALLLNASGASTPQGSWANQSSYTAPNTVAGAYQLANTGLNNAFGILRDVNNNMFKLFSGLLK